MDEYRKIIKSTPLFGHLTQNEITRIASISAGTGIRRGMDLDMRKTGTLCIVQSGMFEIESMGRTDVVYLSPGSFFGSVPFAESRQRGVVKAMVDSSVLALDAEALYKFFLANHKAFRGYLRTLSRMSLEMTESGKAVIDGGARIITVCSPYRASGKSFLSSLIGSSLSGLGRAIILDMNYDGFSLFNFFGRKITSPLSHRQPDGSAGEGMVADMIERVTDNLHLLNVSFGSKVRADSAIISPLLFFLSRDYRYIIIDVSHEDADLSSAAVGQADVVLGLLKSCKDRSRMYEFFDSRISDGQRVFYVLNEFPEGEAGPVKGGLLLEKLPYSGDPDPEAVFRLSGESSVARISGLASKKMSGLVLQDRLLGSAYFAGFLASMRDLGIMYDTIYSSSFGYILASIFLLSRDNAEFRKSFLKFFDEDGINRLLDITFPDNFIFKNSAVLRFASEVAGDARLESMETVPAAMLYESGSDCCRIFTTGHLRDAMAASFCVRPHFEPVSIAGRDYHSGFVGAADLLRSDYERIDHVSVSAQRELTFREGRVLRYYRGLLEDAGYETARGWPADRSFVLDAPVTELRPEKIYEISADISNKLLK
ncbi:MAG: hypothetical protein MUD12_16045 [Spirochaetes bacterium]|jgi:hypothetical protein|nr:hypothetical protein [Spirochaetota bacterium]